MKRVKIADLKNNLSRHLAHVRAGGDLIVLDRDTPVARIVPFGRREAETAAAAGKDQYWTGERIAEMERQGVIARGDSRAMTAWLKNSRPVRLPPGSASPVRLLVQTRRESTR